MHYTYSCTQTDASRYQCLFIMQELLLLVIISSAQCEFNDFICGLGSCIIFVFAYIIWIYIVPKVYSVDSFLIEDNLYNRTKANWVYKVTSVLQMFKKLSLFKKGDQINANIHQIQKKSMTSFLYKLSMTVIVFLAKIFITNSTTHISMLNGSNGKLLNSCKYFLNGYFLFRPSLNCKIKKISAWSSARSYRLKSIVTVFGVGINLKQSFSYVLLTKTVDTAQTFLWPILFRIAFASIYSVYGSCYALPCAPIVN